jgi:hypothetical protein
MGRSIAISWKIGLAVAAIASPFGQLRAQVDDGLPETAETRAQPLESKSVPVILLPAASDALLASSRRAPVEGVPIVMVRPAGNAATNAQLRPEPVKIQENATLVERSPAPESTPRVALLPPVSDAAIAPPQPEPEKTQWSATPVVIPSLPARSPYRQTPFKSEIVEVGPQDAAILQQQVSEPTPPKGNAASRFLANLWPGDKQAKSTAESSPSSADDGEAGSIEQAEVAPKSDKPPIKRFLDELQFWKN